MVAVEKFDLMVILSIVVVVFVIILAGLYSAGTSDNLMGKNLTQICVNACAFYNWEADLRVLKNIGDGNVTCVCRSL